MYLPQSLSLLQTPFCTNKYKVFLKKWMIMSVWCYDARGGDEAAAGEAPGIKTGWRSSINQNDPTS